MEGSMRRCFLFARAVGGGDYERRVVSDLQLDDVSQVSFSSSGSRLAVATGFRI